MAVVDAHQGGQFLEVEAVAPGRRPQFALGLAGVNRPGPSPGLALLSLYGVAAFTAANLSVKAGRNAVDDLAGQTSRKISRGSLHL